MGEITNTKINSNASNARYVQNDAPNTSASSNPRVMDCPQAGWVSDTSGNHARGSTLHAIAEARIMGRPDPERAALMDDADRAAVDYAVNTARAILNEYGAVHVCDERVIDLPGIPNTINGRHANYARADLLAEGYMPNGDRIVMVIDLKFGAGARTWAYDSKCELTAIAAWADMVTADPYATGGTDQLMVAVINGDTADNDIAYHPYDAMQDRMRRWYSIANCMMTSHTCPTGAGAQCIGCGYRQTCPAFEQLGQCYEQTKGRALAATLSDRIAAEMERLAGTDMYDAVRTAVMAIEMDAQYGPNAKRTDDSTPTKHNEHPYTRIYGYAPLPEPDVTELRYMGGYNPDRAEEPNYALE